MKKVLISAFLPFNNQKENFAINILENINSSVLQIDKIILDVCYDKCYIDLKSNFNLDDYDLIIALGEARKRKILTIEKQAKNISSCSIKDNAGVLKIDEIIDPNLPSVLETTLSLNKIPSEYISLDAGKFVCNNLYFHLLKEYPNKSLFIHIPYCDNEDDYNKYSKEILNIIDCL